MDRSEIGRGDRSVVRIHIRVVLRQLVELLGHHGDQVEGGSGGNRLVLHDWGVDRQGTEGRNLQAGEEKDREVPEGWV